MTANESFIRQVTIHRQEVTIDLDDPAFVALNLAPKVIARLREFNAKPPALREAIVDCARKIERNLPTKIRNALTDGAKVTPASICLADWKMSGLCSQEIEALKNFGAHLASELLLASHDRKRQHLVALAAVHGIILPSGQVEWSDDSVKDRAFCLVLKASGLPILHKSQSYPSLMLCSLGQWGACWTFDANYRRFGDDVNSSFKFGVENSTDKVPINSEHFRVARLPEIIAMLSSVSDASGLPKEFISE